MFVSDFSCQKSLDFFILLHLISSLVCSKDLTSNYHNESHKELRIHHHILAEGSVTIFLECQYVTLCLG